MAWTPVIAKIKEPAVLASAEGVPRQRATGCVVLPHIEEAQPRAAPKYIQASPQVIKAQR